MDDDMQDDWLDAVFKKLEDSIDKLEAITSTIWQSEQGFKKENYHYPALSKEDEEMLKNWKTLINSLSVETLQTPMNRGKKVLSQTKENDVKNTSYGKEKEILKIPYHEVLNSAQYEAVTHKAGPQLVIAGAGTGKTRILVYRTAWLIELGVKPENVLLLTFTRKAAREMLNRAETIAGNSQLSKVQGGTFHAFANMILRVYGKMMGMSPNFSIIDMEDATDAIDLVKAGTKNKKSKKFFPNKNRILEIISAARNRNTSITAVVEKDFSGLVEFIDDLNEIYKKYTRYKQLSNLLDYDDLLEIFVKHLEENHRLRDLLRVRYPFILVDEYQDTNFMQHRMLELLAGPEGNITAVGDDMQSIYGFRGARVENMLMFGKSFPGAKLVKLEENYRSHQGILDFTNAVAASAAMQYEKKLYSGLPVINRPFFTRHYNDEEEANYIADAISTLRDEGMALSEIAVLYRASWHSNFLQGELLRRQIPYVVYGGLRFNERRHVKDVISAAKVLLNHRDLLSWHRILKLMSGVGDKTANQIYQQLERQNGTLKMDANFTGKKYGKELKLLLSTLQKSLNDLKTVPLVISTIIEWYAPVLKTIADDYAVRLEDLQVLIKLAEKYNSLESYLSDLALEPPSKRFQDAASPLIDESEEAPIVLSTVHSAKGLEWHTVFIQWVIDGIFPSSMSLEKFQDLEEERRLFYVACTRAKHTLHLSMPSQKIYRQKFYSYPTRFLAEAGPDLFVPENFTQ